MTKPSVPLKTTPLNAIHRRLGAKMIDFGGWDMPVQYASLLEEHHAVRQRVGLFDVSHMGEIEIRGPQALDLVNYVTTNDAAKLQSGQAQYSGLLYEHGGFVDDILVHKVAADNYFLCVNASNQDKDYQHIAAHNHFDATVENAGARYAQLAIQGPRAQDTLQKLAGVALAPMRYYHFADSMVSGAPARIARTGYTGEDGFEIYISPADAARLWDEILAAGAEYGIKPCGLGARNTLRLEAAMALYDHEIHASITPWEANLGWIVKMNKGDFIGREALERQKERGITRSLVGFEMTGRGIGRDGYEVSVDGRGAGWVTSGGPSPTLGKNIGLCYLPCADAAPGRNIQVMVRGTAVDARTVPTPFYKRTK
ncbi:MAG TPA: glycine cleavage system aminomethyltransferase GcvT [Bryobacteraceae bacterium]|nr:glycine cleavage system aminomethyltransferase GcvT [Bryobacteraceae bacterium]